jgi:hypothetical protein
MDPASPPTTTRSAGAPSLAELRQHLESAALAYPELRQGLGAALADVRRALGESVPTRDERRRGLRP